MAYSALDFLCSSSLAGAVCAAKVTGQCLQMSRYFHSHRAAPGKRPPVQADAKTEAQRLAENEWPRVQGKIPTQADRTLNSIHSLKGLGEGQAKIPQQGAMSIYFSCTQ